MGDLPRWAARRRAAPFSVSERPTRRGETDDRDRDHRDRPQRRRHRDDVRDAGRDQGPARDREVPLPGPQPVARRQPQPFDDQGLLRRLRRGHHPHRGLHAGRGRARDPAGHRRGPEPGRVPAARAGRVRDHLAGLLGRRPQREADDGRVDARGRPQRRGRDGHQHRRLPQRLRADPDEHPHRGRRPRREAARGRAARHRPLRGLRLDHEGRAGLRRRRTPSDGPDPGGRAARPGHRRHERTKP